MVTHVYCCSRCTTGTGSLKVECPVRQTLLARAGLTADTPEMVAGVERVLRENRRITLDEVVSELNISHGSAHLIIHNVLGFHKVSARWVPQQLTPELKELHF